jgi:hypothetical protein
MGNSQRRREVEAVADALASPEGIASTALQAATGRTDAELAPEARGFLVAGMRSGSVPAAAALLADIRREQALASPTLEQLASPGPPVRRARCASCGASLESA